jgi:isoquinoline 1-oxidoreductase subunit beta
MLLFGRRYRVGLALIEQIIADGEVQQSNFYGYAVMRMRDIPDIHVERDF